MSGTITAQLDAIDALADELAHLATELADDARLCGSTAVSLGTALGGEAGEQAGAAGTGWSTLLDLLAQHTDVLAGTLRAAVDSYRLTDATLSDRLLARRQGTAPR
ncbi:hypothetical protein ACI79D_03885 [Geodermatophilus sp. SYSU D00708]